MTGPGHISFCETRAKTLDLLIQLTFKGWMKMNLVAPVDEEFAHKIPQTEV